MTPGPDTERTRVATPARTAAQHPANRAVPPYLFSPRRASRRFPTLAAKCIIPLAVAAAVFVTGPAPLSRDVSARTSDGKQDTGEVIQVNAVWGSERLRRFSMTVDEEPAAAGTERGNEEVIQVNAVWGTDRCIEEFAEKPLQPLSDVKLNPYFRPISTTNFYGSGDGLHTGHVCEADYAMVADAEEREQAAQDRRVKGRLDMNLDRKLDEDDLPFIEHRIEHPYGFPGGFDGWNELTKDERREMVMRALAIDETDRRRYVAGEWTCVQFANQLSFNFRGNPRDRDVPEKYSQEDLGLYNIPLETVWMDHETELNHLMNAVLIGDNPADFYDWMFIEPQADEEIEFGKEYSLPYFAEGSRIEINLVDYINKRSSFVEFRIEEGEPVLMFGSGWLISNSRPQITSIQMSEGIPDQIVLSQNRPNPFNATTEISYRVPSSGEYSVRVYSILGQYVASLDHGHKAPGTHTATWDGIDHRGVPAGSGVYLYSLEGRDAGGRQVRQVNRMTLVR